MQRRDPVGLVAPLLSVERQVRQCADELRAFVSGIPNFGTQETFPRYYQV